MSFVSSHTERFFYLHGLSRLKTWDVQRVGETENEGSLSQEERRPNGEMSGLCIL